MFDTLDFAQDILAQELNPAQSAEGLGLSSSNRQHLTAIVAYQHLTDNWDEDSAIAPIHQTALAALDIALLLKQAFKCYTVYKPSVLSSRW